MPFSLRETPVHSQGPWVYAQPRSAIPSTFLPPSVCPSAASPHRGFSLLQLRDETAPNTDDPSNNHVLCVASPGPVGRPGAPWYQPG